MPMEEEGIEEWTRKMKRIYISPNKISLQFKNTFVFMPLLFLLEGVLRVRP
jgi:hypothetical protein